MSDGFHIRYEVNAAAPPSSGSGDIVVGVRVIWPDTATADEVGKAVTTAAAHALAEHEKRTKA